MNDVLEDDRLRYLDVLLEEEFAAVGSGQAAAPALSPHRWIAAALVLLACGVVAGALLLSRNDRVVAQDPQEGGADSRVTPFVPENETELAAFLQQVKRVRVERTVLTRTEHRTEGGLVVVSEGGPFATREIVREDARGFAPLLTGWRSTGDWQGFAAEPVRLTFETADGRRLRGGFEMPTSVHLGRGAWVPGDEGAALLTSLVQAVGTDGVLLEAGVVEMASLDSVSAEVPSLVCPGGPSDDLQQCLPRFRLLRSLTLDSALDDRGATVLTALPLLEHLKFDGSVLGPAGWEALARVPKLRSLCIYGPRIDLPAASLRAFAGRLEALAIVGGVAQSLGDAGHPVTAEHLRAISTFERLVELRVAVTWDATVEGLRDQGFLLDALVAMPKLRRLGLAQRNGGPGIVWGRLAKSKFEKLQLAGFELDRTAVGALASISSLREVDLRTCGFSGGAQLTVAKLTQVTLLDLRLTQVPESLLSWLSEQLPHTAVLGAGGFSGRSWPVLGLDPSWTR